MNVCAEYGKNTMYPLYSYHVEKTTWNALSAKSSFTSTALAYLVAGLCSLYPMTIFTLIPAASAAKAGKNHMADCK